MLPKIDNIEGFNLPPEARSILQRMFAGYRRVVVKGELTGGLGGSRVIVVRPIRADGTAELPVVVKLASVSLIEKEWRAYRQCVHAQLPRAAKAIGPPSTLEGSDWSGLGYPQIGGTFKVHRLSDYVRRRNVTVDDVRFVLKRLLTIIERIVRLRQPYPEFRLRASYDLILPVNLLVEPTQLPPGAEPLTINPMALPSRPPVPGEPVRVEGFAITKVDLIDKSVTLNLPALDSPDAYCLRLRPIEAAQPYRIDQIVGPIEGVVSRTRYEWLEAEAANVLGEGVDLADKTLTLADGTSLLNPLPAWPALLGEFRDVHLSCIHGDLNLENILVDRDTREVSLIDFSEARQDLVLHDFLRLETEVMTKLVPEILSRHSLPPASTLIDFCSQLHCAAFQDTLYQAALPHPGLEKPFAMLTAIRRTARKYLLDGDRPGEYYHGLTLYLLGALKFRNLDRASKQIAFWGATLAYQYLTMPPAPISVTCPPPLAVIIGVRPEVKVVRAGTDRLQEASFGTPLYRGDMVSTYARAGAVVVCHNGLLFELPAQCNFPVDCTEREDVQSTGQLGPIVPNPAISLTQALALLQAQSTARTSRTEQAQKPLLLSPRNTLVADPRPSFHWQHIPDATHYLLELIMPGGQSWDRMTKDPTLPYPDDAPPLTPGSSNLVSLTAFGPTPFVRDETLLRVLTDPRLAELEEAKATIQSLTIDKGSQAYLLVQLYQEQGLLSDAIAQLEHLVARQHNPSAHLSQRLGDLYFEIELYTRAEAHYREALKIAQASLDLSAQASAQTGLGRIAAVFGEAE